MIYSTSLWVCGLQTELNCSTLSLTCLTVETGLGNTQGLLFLLLNFSQDRRAQEIINEFWAMLSDAPIQALKSSVVTDSVCLR